VLVADPEAWTAAGFALAREACVLGAVRIRLTGPGAGRGIASWSLREAGDGDLDGLTTTRATRPPPAPSEHPNGALALDHVVVMTPDLDRTTGALESRGIECRRVREAGPARQAFFRLGEVILEVVWTPEVPAGPARFWGLVVRVADLAPVAERLGPHLGSIRDAVQPGRRIATARKEARLGVRVAFMTPRG
jgi:hypothetical protein